METITSNHEFGDQLCYALQVASIVQAKETLPQNSSAYTIIPCMITLLFCDRFANQEFKVNRLQSLVQHGAKSWKSKLMCCDFLPPILWLPSCESEYTQLGMFIWCSTINVGALHCSLYLWEPIESPSCQLLSLNAIRAEFSFSCWELY